MGLTNPANLPGAKEWDEFQQAIFHANSIATTVYAIKNSADINKKIQLKSLEEHMNALKEVIPKVIAKVAEAES